MIRDEWLVSMAKDGNAHRCEVREMAKELQTLRVRFNQPPPPEMQYPKIEDCCQVQRIAHSIAHSEVSQYGFIFDGVKILMRVIP